MGGGHSKHAGKNRQTLHPSRRVTYHQRSACSMMVICDSIKAKLFTYPRGTNFHNQIDSNNNNSNNNNNNNNNNNSNNNNKNTDNNNNNNNNNNSINSNNATNLEANKR